MERTPEDLVVEYAETLPYLASPHNIRMAVLETMEDYMGLGSYLGKRVAGATEKYGLITVNPSLAHKHGFRDI
jgi:hypothetical protein